MTDTSVHVVTKILDYMYTKYVDSSPKGLNKYQIICINELNKLTFFFLF